MTEEQTQANEAVDPTARPERIKYSDMVAGLAKSGTAILATLTPEDCHSFHMLLGLAGEIGELVNFDGTITHLIEECGDFEFYFEGLRQRYGVTYEQVHVQPEAPRRGRAPLQMIQIATAELVDTIKKEIIYRKPIDTDRLIAEMRELEYALTCFYASREIKRIDILEANIAKLSERYKGLQYSDAAAQARADKPAGQ